ncbi:kinase-like domain-containing protein [Endogone sp. FLAS-F59071]|nr:kinase-like domain-containing protein [Endogone sp. FLAS-F59071]|eukprot:RUS18232.1 kinase-like domain-containing protein [Endogone sp. FLAS-F59071]
MAHFGCTASKSRITTKFVGLSLHPETKKYLMVTECGEYNLEQYKVLDIEPESSDGFWCSICNISLLLADCLECLHSSGFKHQNLDPTNVIMHKKSLRLINIDRPNHHRRQNYLPPEFFDNKPYTLESDIYCLGTLIWQLVTGIPPLGTASERPDGLREDFPPGMPKKFKSIIEDCWRLDPFRRPSASEVWERLHRCQEEMRSCKLSPETRAFIIKRRSEANVEFKKYVVVEKNEAKLHDHEDFIFVKKGGKDGWDSDGNDSWILEEYDEMDREKDLIRRA